MNIDFSLGELGNKIADGDIDLHALAPLLAVAERLGLVPVAAAVLTDPAEPYVARCRAFDRVATAVRTATERGKHFTVAA